MILFLNFAPLSFGGGAERWITSVSEELSKNEKVIRLEVDKSIADQYAKLVLKRKFDNRVDTSNPYISSNIITISSLIPFSKSGNKLRKMFREARVIYTKFEINESLLLFYFGGASILNKTVFGLHSPFLYGHDKLSLMERIHNIVYHSRIIKNLLRKAQKVHILSPEQEIHMRNEFGLKNTVLVPNFYENHTSISNKTKSDLLNICFIGELDERKGADILLEIIKMSPQNFIYNIIGNGHLNENFLKLDSPSSHYLGYLDKKEVNTVLSTSDILIIPSRAESFSLVSLEALSHGLSVVSSPHVSLSILKKYLVINKEGTTDGYINTLKRLYRMKKDGTLQLKRKEIASEIEKIFSKRVIMSMLKEQVFG